MSPTLATSLPKVIAIAAAVVTYAWITICMGSEIQQAGFLSYKANMNFRIGNIITIATDNSGTSNEQIVQVYIGTSATALENQKPTPSTMPLVISAITRFNFTSSWSAGETHCFRVVPNSRATLTFQDQTPPQISILLTSANLNSKTPFY